MWYQAAQSLAGRARLIRGKLPPKNTWVPILAFDQKLQTETAQAQAPVSLPEALPLASWPQSFVNPTHAPGNIKVSDGFKTVWKASIGKGDSRTTRLIAQPVINQGRLYAMGGNQNVTALDLATGKKLWSVRLDSGNKRDKTALGGGVAFEDDRLYVTSGYGFSVALNPADGTELWRHNIGKPFQTPPVVSQGIVYGISSDNEIFALSSETGERLWTWTGIAEPARMLTAPLPAVEGDVVIAPFSSGELAALHAKTGRLLWADELTGVGRLSPLSSLNDIPGAAVMHEGAAYAMNQNGILTAVRITTGERLWSQPLGGFNTPWIAGSYLFVLGEEGQLVCLNRKDGTIVWTTQLATYKNEKKRKGKIVWTGPVLINSRLLVLSSVGEALEIDSTEGDILRRFKPGGNFFIPPVIAGDTLYLLNDKAQIIALR